MLERFMLPIRNGFAQPLGWISVWLTRGSDLKILADTGLGLENSRARAPASKSLQSIPNLFLNPFNR